MNQNSHLPLSTFYFLERKAPSRPALSDLAACVSLHLTGLNLPAEKLRGRRIAVAVGSRGIASLQEIVRAVCGWLKSQGAIPFVFPSMGSHGGGTADGQRRILAEYGITEAGVGAEIRSSIDTLQVNTTSFGFPVFADRLGDSIFGRNPALAVGRSAPVATHGRKDEGDGALRLQPAAHGADNLLQAGDAAASHRDRDTPAAKLFRGKVEAGKMKGDASRQIRKRRPAGRLSLQKVEGR